jgi:hypothetical protein
VKTRVPAGIRGAAVHRVARAALRRTVGSLLRLWPLPIFVASDFLAAPWFEPKALGVDAVLYHHAAGTWLSGGNPWRDQTLGVPYSAPPLSLIPYGPTAWLPEQVGGGIWLALGVVAAIWLLRRLDFPAWWILFPPMFEGVWHGNIQIVVVALLVGGGVRNTVLATVAKIYASLVPLFNGNWRAILAIVAAVIVSAPLLPWATYFAEFPRITESLNRAAWQGGAFPLGAIPWFATLVGLLGTPSSWRGWLAVPALWPATQPYYSTLALPVVRQSPILITGLAIPWPPAPAVAVCLVGLVTFWRRLGTRRAWPRSAAAATSG